MFLSRGDIKLSQFMKTKEQIDENTDETISKIFEILQENNSKWKVIELFDNEKKSQHLAFLNSEGKIYDETFRKGIRFEEDLSTLLDEYKDLFGNAYFQIHRIKPEQQENVNAFIAKYE